MGLVSFTHKLGVVFILAQICCTTLADNLITTDAWIQVTAPINPPSARQYHSAVYDQVNGTMVIFGGSSASSVAYNDISYYSMTTGLWSTGVTVGGSIPMARYGHSAVTTGMNTMIVFGGRNSTTPYNDISVFNLLSNQWVSVTTTGPPPPPRAFHSAVVDTYYHNMYVYGGTDGTNFFQDLYELNLDTFAWTCITNTTSAGPRAWHVAVMSHSRVMVVYGGIESSGTTLGDVQCFSPDTQMWWSCNAGSSTPGLRYGHTAVISPLEQMVIFGGMDSNGDMLSDVWDFDLSLYTWSSISPTGNPIAGVAYHSAIATPFGSMIIFGGETSASTITNTFGVYNLVSTVIRSADDGAVLVVILTLGGTVLLSLCFAMDYMQELSEIEKEEAIQKAKQEQLLLPKLPHMPKIPLGPRAQKFIAEFKTSLDPLKDPPA